MASIAREKVDEVMDAHLELLSIVVCTIIWAVCYGWIEANAVGPFQVLYFDKHGHLWPAGPAPYLFIKRIDSTACA